MPETRNVTLPSGESPGPAFPMAHRGGRLTVRLLAVALASLAGTRLAAQAPAADAWKVGVTIDASYVSATGNSQVTTVAFGDKVAATRGHWTLRQAFSYVNAKTDSVEIANQIRAELRGEYKITNEFSAFAGATYERNVYAGFNRRIEELAGLLDGAVGCSRAVTMAGWRPHTDQVGQTGTKIAPNIYIACGISGATQHMAGCKGAKTIIAVNTDPEAPILASADYAVIGDLHEVVPAISAELRKAKGA